MRVAHAEAERGNDMALLGRLREQARRLYLVHLHVLALRVPHAEG
jgi:hypothetical protein